MKQKITFQYVNIPVMNAVQKMRLKMTKKKYSFVEKADLILKRKRKPEIFSPQSVREF